MVTALARGMRVRMLMEGGNIHCDDWSDGDEGFCGTVMIKGASITMALKVKFEVMTQLLQRHDMELQNLMVLMTIELVLKIPMMSVMMSVMMMSVMMLVTMTLMMTLVIAMAPVPDNFSDDRVGRDEDCTAGNDHRTLESAHDGGDDGHDDGEKVDRHSNILVFFDALQHLL